MSNNDYFTVAYKILSYLKYCYERGELPDKNILQADTFGISKLQFIQTLKMLSEDGHIQGIRFQTTKLGDILVGLENIRITSNGLQYLAENTMMQKAYKIFKEVRDWLPLLK